MKKPLISVVFTSYNHKVYLRQALDSILAQTFSDFEVIVIDDCSTDGSQEILKEYAQKDSRIKLTLNRINSGSYVYSTNQGAAQATAPYLIFAQCDDWAEQSQYEKLYNAVTENDVKVAFCCSKMVDEAGHSLGFDIEARDSLFKKRYKNGGVISKEDAFKSLVISCMIPNLSAAIVDSRLYNKLKGFSSNYVVMSDWDFWIRAAATVNFYYIPEALNNFRQHSGTIRSVVKVSKQLEERFMIYSVAKLLKPELVSFVNKWAPINWILSIRDGWSIWLKTFGKVLKLGHQLTPWWIVYTILAICHLPVLYLKKLNK